MKKIALFFVFNFIFLVKIFPQKNKFEKEIIQFEKHDSLYFPPKGANLFVGSSSIKLWQLMETDFSGYQVINRGFGGSNLVDLAYFTERIILKYEPSKIFIYSGENDIADSSSASETLERFKTVFYKIRNSLPKVPILFISIKPSIARFSQYPTQIVANQLIKKFLAEQSNTKFINIVPKMMLRGKPNPSLFLGDKLHMNRKGYEIWTKKLKKHLTKN